MAFNKFIENNNIVGLDLDDTLTDYKVGLSLINEYFNVDYLNTSNPQFNLVEGLGITSEENDSFWKTIYPKYVSEARLSIRGEFIIEELSNVDNCKFVIVTARPESTRKLTSMWVSEHVNLPIDEIVFLGHHNKVEAVSKMNCNLFIDDRDENINQLSTINGLTTILVPNWYTKPTELADYILTEDCKLLTNNNNDILEVTMEDIMI